MPAPCHNQFMAESKQLLEPRPPEPAPQIPDAGAPSSGPFAPERRPLYRRIGTALLAVGALIVKFGAKLKVLLVALPKLKLLSTSGSMLVSIGAYSLIWGWRFAVGFVLLLLVHELGHVIQLRREGVPASAPLFIPFLGAVVGMKRLPDNALAEARVGLAGPVLGSLGAAALIPVYLATDNHFWQALAFTGLFLNLINLLPVLPLDGGRAMAAMAPWMWFVGFAAMIGVAVAFPNPVILLILLFAGLETWRRWKQRRAGDEAQRAYYRVPPAARLAVAGVYVGLIVALAVGLDATHVPRSLSDA